MDKKKKNKKIDLVKLSMKMAEKFPEQVTKKIIAERVKGNKINELDEMTIAALIFKDIFNPAEQKMILDDQALWDYYFEIVGAKK